MRRAMLVLLALGATGAAIQCNRTELTKNYTRLKWEDVATSTELPVHAPAMAELGLGALEYVCTDQEKVVCEWRGDPDAPRRFEYTNGTSGHDWSGSPTDVELEARCGAPTTAPGICDPWPGNDWDPDVVSVQDIGLCSSSLPTDLFLSGLAGGFQDQADERLGEQRAPEGRDVVLWTDFVLGLKKGDWPVEVFTDYNRVEALGRGHWNAEIVMRASYRVDGNLEFKPDAYWLGDGVGTQIASIFIQTALYTTPIGWIGAVFIGDCERDRPLVLQLRGELVATEDHRGVGIRINRYDACGPDGDWPCTWASVLDWPARPLCNNRVKPDIESNLLEGAVAAMSPTGMGVACLTCTAEGGSTLPFETRDGEPLPIRDVVLTPDRVHFVHIKDPNDDPLIYLELLDRGMCGADRSISTKTTQIKKQGEHVCDATINPLCGLEL